MKKPIFALTAAVAFLAFAACDKNTGSNGDDGVPSTISGVIQNMPTDAKNYALNIYIDGARDKVVETCVVAADGSFTFPLPETVTSNDYDELENYIKMGFDVSNPDAKIWSLYIVLFGDGVEIESIVCIKYTITESLVEFTQVGVTYSDSDFTITGSGMAEKENDSSANMSYVKGWNWTVIDGVKSPEDASFKFSTKLPDGMQWHLVSDTTY